MVFSSLVFLYFFLPLAGISYFLCKNRAYRNGLLLVLSLLFYAWGEPKYVVMLLLVTVVAYAGGRGMAALEGRKPVRKLVFLGTVSLIVLNLLVFKYLTFFWENICLLISNGNYPPPRSRFPLASAFTPSRSCPM